MRRSSASIARFARLKRLACMACLAPWPPMAAADIDDRLPDRWYAIEVIVLQRTGVTEANSIERLVHSGERSFPAGIAATATGPAGAGYRLDPLTLATLEFATLAFACAAAADADAQPDRPIGVPAWYQPAAPGRPGEPRVADMDTPVTPMGSGTAAEPTTAGSRGSPATDAAADSPPLVEAAAPAQEITSLEPIATQAVAALSTTAPQNACIAAGPGAGHLAHAAAAACPPARLDIPLAPGRPKALCAKAGGVPAPPIKPVLEAHPLLDWLRALGRFEREMQAASYRPGTGGARLNREAGRIRSAGGLQLLWHGRWTQPVPSRATSEPLLIQAGPQSELLGTFDITQGTLLHFHARLWLHDPGLTGLAATALEPATIAAASLAAASTTAADLPRAAAAVPARPATADSYMVLQERRVMRKGTLHYLDHPKLGILVRADPVQPPDWLVDASAALEATEFVD